MGDNTTLVKGILPAFRSPSLLRSRAFWGVPVAFGASQRRPRLHRFPSVNSDADDERDIFEFDLDVIAEQKRQRALELAEIARIEAEALPDAPDRAALARAEAAAAAAVDAHVAAAKALQRAD